MARVTREDRTMADKTFRWLSLPRPVRLLHAVAYSDRLSRMTFAATMCLPAGGLSLSSVERTGRSDMEPRRPAHSVSARCFVNPREEIGIEAHIDDNFAGARIWCGTLRSSRDESLRLLVRSDLRPLYVG